MLIEPDLIPTYAGFLCDTWWMNLNYPDVFNPTGKIQYYITKNLVSVCMYLI